MVGSPLGIMSGLRRNLNLGVRLGAMVTRRKKANYGRPLDAKGYSGKTSESGQRCRNFKIFGLDFGRKIREPSKSLKKSTSNIRRNRPQTTT